MYEPAKPFEEYQPCNAYFNLLAQMKTTLEILYPGKRVEITSDMDGTRNAVTVFDVGVHGCVRYQLDYENESMKDWDKPL
jgi:hypothetical protein